MDRKEFSPDSWALILGGSSGFGLAAAHRLAKSGMNLFLVHRDRRGAMARIEPEFDKLRSHGVQVVTRNANALDADVRSELLCDLTESMGESGRVRLLLHSIALGNLRPLAAPRRSQPDPAGTLAGALGCDGDAVRQAADQLFEGGEDALFPLAQPAVYSDLPLEDEDFSQTIFAKGTSHVAWTRDVLARGLFAEDARVLGLTSEGNEVAWRGYAAVSAAKVALEAISRSMALELAPYGIRSNIVQPGVTDTPALRAIPGHAQLRSQARLRNPMGRLTTPRDIATVIYLLARNEAGWINGAVIRVDGGERISGAAA